MRRRRHRSRRVVIAAPRRDLAVNSPTEIAEVRPVPTSAPQFTGDVDHLEDVTSIPASSLGRRCVLETVIVCVMTASRLRHRQPPTDSPFNLRHARGLMTWLNLGGLTHARTPDAAAATQYR